MKNVEKKSLFGELFGKDNKAMAEERLYSNPQNTTNKIKLALLELLGQRELAKINITDLVKVAGIYRATFYLHYKNLNDVILSIEQDVQDCYNTLKGKVANIDLYNNMSVLVETIGEYIKVDKKYLKIIINTQCFNRITLKLKELLHEILIDNFTKFGHMKYDNEFKLNISMFTGGLVFAYRDWINDRDMEFDELENCIKKIGKSLFNKNQ